jgi:hypothetical protein
MMNTAPAAPATQKNVSTADDADERGWERKPASCLIRAHPRHPRSKFFPFGTGNLRSMRGFRRIVASIRQVQIQLVFIFVYLFFPLWPHVLHFFLVVGPGRRVSCVFFPFASRSRIEQNPHSPRPSQIRSGRLLPLIRISVIRGSVIREARLPQKSTNDARSARWKGRCSPVPGFTVACCCRGSLRFYFGQVPNGFQMTLPESL